MASPEALESETQEARMRAIKVNWPWNGKETESMIKILVERGIGFTLNNRGLNVELAEGTSEEECRSMMADALAEKGKKQQRRVK